MDRVIHDSLTAVLLSYMALKVSCLQPITEPAFLSVCWIWSFLWLHCCLAVFQSILLLMFTPRYSPVSMLLPPVHHSCTPPLHSQLLQVARTGCTGSLWCKVNRKGDSTAPCRAPSSLTPPSDRALTLRTNCGLSGRSRWAGKVAPNIFAADLADLWIRPHCLDVVVFSFAHTT